MNKVIGAGISGLVLARRIAQQGEKVELIEAKPYIGGLLYDYLLNGFYVSDSGVHIFHTNNEEIMKYLENFEEFIAYNHIVSADVYEKGFAINFPTSLNNRLSKKDFENLYKYYSIKQWGKMPSKKILDRCKPRENNCLYFFQDKYVAIPLNGWTEVCKRIAWHKNIKIITDKEFTLQDIGPNDKIYYTGRLDKLFGYKYGEMKYRKIEIVNSLKGDDFANVLNKSRPDCQYTRVINWRRCSAKISHEDNLYGYEFSKNASKEDLSPHYIIEDQEKTYEQYKKECKKYNIIPFGRVGGNKYINIDEAIKCAMTLPL